MRKIAVIFPGIGYNHDRPLLYHAAKLAASFGYETIKISYPACEVNLKGADSSQIRAFVDECIVSVRKSLDEMKLSDADDMIFISKSIGTAVACAYANAADIHPRHILFTPLEETFEFAGDGCGIAFTGTKDPWADHDKIRELCAEKNIMLTTVKGANHSLETQDVIFNIKTLLEVIKAVCSYLSFYDRI